MSDKTLVELAGELERVQQQLNVSRAHVEAIPDLEGEESQIKEAMLMLIGANAEPTAEEVRGILSPNGHDEAQPIEQPTQETPDTYGF